MLVRPATSEYSATTGATAAPRRAALSPGLAWALLLAVFVAVHFASLFSPALLDDADATHAQAAQHMAQTGDWVTLKVNGIRYLEKPPLPYWLVAADYRIFGEGVFSTHLPMALAVLGCAALAWVWGRRAYGDRAGLYAGLGVLTSMGVFLFTRFFIPEALLTFFMTLALYCFFTALEDDKPARYYVAWASLAVALLTKGLIAPVFFFAAIIPHLIFTGQWRRWRSFKIVSGGLLFLAIAAPWHILAALQNPDQGNPAGNVPSPGHVHGFFYFYFLNEHIFRFLGTRYPHDYNRVHPVIYWLQHLAYLFPWSLYFPIAIRRAWRTRHEWLGDLQPYTARTVDFYLENAAHVDVATRIAAIKFRARTTWLLGLFAAVILVFFSLSTNQEYYTWPAYLPLLILTAGALATEEESDVSTGRWLTATHAVFAVVGALAAAALGYGLWASRSLPYVADIGTMLAHRAVGGYTLATSHLFDLTGPSFAALRLPAAIAAFALLTGPAVAWLLRVKRQNLGATITLALTAAFFLFAAHIALVRFEPMLSSRAMAETINHRGAPSDTLMLYGDQADGSSVIFYTHRFIPGPALLVHGRSSSMIWGSYYPDAPPIFLEDEDLLSLWGTGSRKWLFVPGDWHAHVNSLLGKQLYEVQELSDKTLYTDRPLN